MLSLIEYVSRTVLYIFRKDHLDVSKLKWALTKGTFLFMFAEKKTNHIFFKTIPYVVCSNFLRIRKTLAFVLRKIFSKYSTDIILIKKNIFNALSRHFVTEAILNELACVITHVGGGRKKMYLFSSFWGTRSKNVSPIWSIFESRKRVLRRNQYKKIELAAVRCWTLNLYVYGSLFWENMR